MTDYSVYKDGDKLELLLYSQYREEDHLMHGLTPGTDFVAISEAITSSQA